VALAAIQEYQGIQALLVSAALRVIVEHLVTAAFLDIVALVGSVAQADSVA
jgi:hypothetical protein